MITADARPTTDGGPKRNAVFGIHGISPTQRYAFQDQVALELKSYLNEQELAAHSGLTWDAVIHWPKVGTGNDSPAVRPSALRIYRSDEVNPANPTGVIYDVYEGYWSPLSKGKTNLRSALSWLLNALFLGSSSTANIPCTKDKLKSDLGYVGLLLGLALVILALATLLGLGAWFMLMQAFTAPLKMNFWDIIANPLNSALRMPILAYVEFAVDIALVYVLGQLVAVYRVSFKRRQRAKDLGQGVDPKGRFADQTIKAQTFHGMLLYVLWGALVVLLAVAYGFAFLDKHVLEPHAATMFPIYAALVIVSVTLLQSARNLGTFAVENVLGDIQIYTTHDANSTYYSIREQIIQTVTNALTGVLSTVDPDPMAKPNTPYYDRIHIFGHSLGSTVAMDVLIRLRQMLQEGSLVERQWPLIRSLTTFGTALEKTKFFFDVRQPTISAASDQWQNDVYGRFFTDDSKTLDQPDNRDGIFWSNIWYFRDIVANQIVSYASDVSAAPTDPRFAWNKTAPARTICVNHLLEHDRPRIAWVHSDYLKDPLFWQNVGPMLTRVPAAAP